MSDARPPIFILGSERSGTNLLRTLLNNHSGVHAPVAPHFLNAFYGGAPRYGDLRDAGNMARLLGDMKMLAEHPYHGWRLEADAARILERFRPANLVEAFDAMYRASAEQAGKPHYACKDNDLFKYASDIRSLCPGAKFVYLVRDPRDHAASWLKTPIYLFTAYDVAEKWAAEQRACRRLRDSLGLDVFTVRYEDLIADPEASMTGLLRFCGLAPEPACFRTDPDNPESLRNEFWKNLSRPILSGNREKYRTQLSSKQVAVIEGVCGEEMRACGYVLEGDGRWRPSRLHPVTHRLERWLARQRRSPHWPPHFLDKQRLVGELSRRKTGSLAGTS